MKEYCTHKYSVSRFFILSHDFCCENRYHVSWDKISLRYLIVLCLISICPTLIYCSESQNHNCLILSHDFKVFGEYKGAQHVHWPGSEIVRQKTIENRETKWDSASGPALTDAQGVILYTSIYHGRLSACQPSLYATRLGIYPYKMLRRFWNFQHLFCFRVYTV